MNNIIRRVWNQNRMVNIEDLRGMAFQAEIGGHTFEISGINDANEAVSLSGTVAGVFMRPDGADVALTGTASDGVVSVTLSDACYAVAGRFGLTIFVTADSKKTCVYACIGTVAQTSYGTVAGDTPQDVVDLINAINAAIASIPADYTDLMAAIAPTYSNTALYAVGSYAWYNGVLYRCTTAITTAEAWTAAHWTQVALANDVDGLKSVITQMQTRYIKCESGTFADANGSQKVSNVKRLRNAMPIAIDNFDSITIPDGYQGWIFRLDKYGTAISAYSNWVSGKISFSNTTIITTATKYLNIAFKKTDEPNNNISAYADTLAEGLILKPNENFMYDESLTLSILGTDKLFYMNGLLNLYGKFGRNNSYKATDFIRVNQGQIIKYNLRGTSSLTILGFYTDRNENSFVSGSSVVGTGNYKSGEFTAPSNGYIRACTENYNFNLAYCYTEIEPNKRNFGGEPIEKELNVLLMGDSIFGSDGEIASYLDELCGSCTNGAFGGTQVKVRSASSDNFKYFDGVNIVTALCNQTWTDQDAAATALESTYPWVPTRLATLKAVDMSNIDLLIMDWGTNDYTAGATIEDITTAYNTVIDLLQTTYPELRILITTPIWRYWGTEADNENGDTKVYNVSTLKEIALAIEDFMKNKRISVLNAYQNLPLSYKTALTYFDANDKTHLNTFGNKVYAYLLHGKIRSIY